MCEKLQTDMSKVFTPGSRVGERPWPGLCLWQVCGLHGPPGTLLLSVRPEPSWLPNAAELFHDRDLAVQHPLAAISHRCLDQPNVSDEPLEAGWAERCSLVAAEHRSIECDMALDHGCAHSHRGDTGRQSRLVSRVADGDAREAIP